MPWEIPKTMGSTNTMTPSECNKKCAEKNFSYFGVEFWSYCWCDNKAPLEQRRGNIVNCDYECAGNRNLKCGGEDHHMNIWKVCKDQDCKFSYE